MACAGAAVRTIRSTASLGLLSQWPQNSFKRGRIDKDQHRVSSFDCGPAVQVQPRNLRRLLS
jgi:hypothetical protein